jgi:hypothetical protein
MVIIWYTELLKQITCINNVFNPQQFSLLSIELQTWEFSLAHLLDKRVWTNIFTSQIWTVQ